MNFLISILGCLAAGAALGTGFALTLSSISKAKRRKEKRKLTKEEIRNNFDYEVYSKKTNTIYIPVRYINVVRNTISVLRESFWKKDIVIPYLELSPYKVPDNDFVIKIDGNIVYRNQLVENESEGKVADLIRQHVGKYYEGKGALKIEN